MPVRLSHGFLGTFVALALLAPASIAEEGFRLSQSREEIGEIIGRYPLESMAVGDRLYIYIDAICQKGDQIFVDNRTLSRTHVDVHRRERFEYIIDVLPHRTVSLRTPYNAQDYQDLIELTNEMVELYFVPECDRYVSFYGGNAQEFFKISSIHGFRSMTEMLGQIKSMAEAK